MNLLDDTKSETDYNDEDPGQSSLEAWDELCKDHCPSHCKILHLHGENIKMS